MILILLAVIALGVAVWKGAIYKGTGAIMGGGLAKLTGSGSGSLAENINASTKSAMTPAGSGSASAPATPANGSAQSPFKGVAGTDGKLSEEVFSRVYKFRFREPPAVGDLPIAGSLGCSVSVDPVSGSVLIAGKLTGVDAVFRYLEAIDVSPGSCSVQSWAVYVDKSAQKGFDLVAALGDVLNTRDVLTVGTGGLTLDASGDAVAVALNAICDGTVVEVVQRPHVQLRHGVLSTVESIQEIPVPNTAVSQGIAQTSVEYRKVGLQLGVTPYFLANDRLKLSITQTNGLLGRNVRIGENDVPIIESQTVTSAVEMSVGQTVVLGGVSTLRKRTVRGLLRTTDEVTEGSLYVIVSTSFDAPKAIPVSGVLAPLSSQAPPLVPPSEDAVDWIDGELLPKKGWEREEAELVRSKARK
ncbi:MAG: hypothetical protein ABIT37_10610 [Luteolibacter sp.]